MEQTILNWLLEEQTPEVRLRTLKEYRKLSEDDEEVVNCKGLLLQSKVYERGLKKLKKDKPWDKYDAILAFAEWGLTRDDIGDDIDDEVFALIESTGFKMLCGEPLLLRNLVKLGYYTEDIVKNEIDSVLKLIKEDGVVTVLQEFRSKPFRASSDQYDSFRTFIRAVNKAYTAQIVLVKE